MISQSCETDKHAECRQWNCPCPCHMAKKQDADCAEVASPTETSDATIARNPEQYGVGRRRTVEG